ncbi:hypothetical protein GCM10007298_19150 [Williamsia phyllosphaerae]|uniref:Uncharacterized protein n=1 Tax=Williamsia phyllosphaerae TaxID=885042 RepID=A0ABQ1UNN4_9NOCA|nr:hypothetical protein GCM10007298_19150 [Williamsia phyllosphaerae]
MWTGGSQRNVQLYQKNSTPCQARGNGLEALRGAIQPVAAGHLSLWTSVQPAGGRVKRNAHFDVEKFREGSTQKSAKLLTSHLPPTCCIDTWYRLVPLPEACCPCV